MLIRKGIRQRVQSGKYFAGIYLPKDFSKDLLSFTSGDINKPKIEYSINEKLMQLRRKLRQKALLPFSHKFRKNSLKRQVVR